MFQRFIHRMLRDESGATAIEYALIAVFVSIAMVGALLLIGPQVNAGFESVGEGFTQ